MQIYSKLFKTFMIISLLGFISFSNITIAQESAKLITGEGEGWIPLTEKDFQNVNTDPDTWKWMDGMIFCKGTPVGVTRSKKKYTNFEMVATWRHMKHAGNSGIFLWASEDGLEGLKPNQLLLKEIGVFLPKMFPRELENGTTITSRQSMAKFAFGLMVNKFQAEKIVTLKLVIYVWNLKDPLLNSKG